MRASRAYIAGVGTTGVLVASAVLLLAVVSALVAFQGWPGSSIGENIGSLVVDEPERLAVDGPPQIALNASAAAAAVASSAAPGTAAAGTSVLRTPADFQRTAGVPRIDVVAPPPPGSGIPRNFRQGDGNGRPSGPSAGDGSPGGLLPETPLSPQVNRLTDTLGDTTQGLTDNLGGTVGELNPQLGRTVSDAGWMLAELLRSLGRSRRY